MEFLISSCRSVNSTQQAPTPHFAEEGQTDVPGKVSQLGGIAAGKADGLGSHSEPKPRSASPAMGLVDDKAFERTEGSIRGKSIKVGDVRRVRTGPNGKGSLFWNVATDATGLHQDG